MSGISHDFGECTQPCEFCEAEQIGMPEMGYPTYGSTDLDSLKFNVREATKWLDEHRVITREADDALRVGKLLEEGGEAMQKYIGWVGQNPRKGIVNSREEFYEEVADSAMTALSCLQHFTNDIDLTFEILFARARYVRERLCG